MPSVLSVVCIVGAWCAPTRDRVSRKHVLKGPNIHNGRHNRYTLIAIETTKCAMCVPFAVPEFVNRHVGHVLLLCWWAVEKTLVGQFKDTILFLRKHFLNFCRFKTYFLKLSGFSKTFLKLLGI